MVELSIGKVELEPTWCNEELMSSIWGAGNPNKTTTKKVSQQKLLVPQSLRNAGKVL